ncbi:MAG: glycogen/starch/alpha-glucan phosphorylase [Ruminococcaceae bacterium]|nr:glycogen/starch/alpha-glucan phosphorylase [Oscillospiraceae bacterium]
MNISKENFINDYKRKMISMYQVSVEDAPDMVKYMTLGATIRDYMSYDWHETQMEYDKSKTKKVYYFSMEFLIGRLMDSALINLGIKDVVEEGLNELGIDLAQMEEIEPDAGLGNGGLGRLAACFMDSMASIGVPGVGIGLRYRYGLFKQQIINGYQIESPDDWLKIANVWETRRDNEACMVKFGGTCNTYWGDDGKMYVSYTDYEPILAVPYDMPVPGYKNGVVNTLRLWSAETGGVGFDFATFSRGDFEKAIESQSAANSITSVLYPDDSTARGKLLRLKQEYFFTSAGIQSIINQAKKNGVDLYELDKYVAIHINDTHPALAVPELMRILMDENGMSWEDSWNITVKTLGYTNHTILAEALEKWNVNVFKHLLPRVYMIVEEINRRFCSDLQNKYGGDWNKVSRMSIIQDGVVKMAHLAIVGSHSVNGVAKLHTDILKEQELSDFHQFYEGKFNNKTNGITHRRWLMQANPELATLIDNTIGTSWQKMPLDLKKLRKYENDAAFIDSCAQVKQHNKERLAKFIKENYNITVDPTSVFDIQVKRLHMYKRQILNVLHIMDLYNRLCENPALDITPRTFIFGAKAFPGYTIAKNTIKLICTVADKINNDKRVADKLKVVFVPNYGVSLAQIMIPAGDISEQISTASKEASGTGNMKFMMNGAVTVATLDGANVEIHEAVGDDNIVLFGLRSEEVIAYQKNGNYRVQDVIKNDVRLQNILRQISQGYFGLAPESDFDLILDQLVTHNDPFFTLRDFGSYVDAQNRISHLYRDTNTFRRMSVVNIAESGIFSSDNTIKNYAEEIWNVRHDYKA